MSLWTRWFARTPARDAADDPAHDPAHVPIPVVLYTRAGCGLCDEMKAAVLGAGAREPFELCEVDVDRDPALAARHGLALPVLAIDGHVAFKVRLVPADFRAQLTRRVRERARRAAERAGER